MGQRSSLVLGLQQTFFLPKPAFTEKELGDLSGTVTILTGGYAGIGLQLAHILYGANATIYVAGRSQEKATRAIQEIQQAHPESKGKLHFLHVDLADLSTIKPAVEEFMKKEERLDVLMNNAGVMWPPDGSKSAQGHDLQIGTNVYGPFLLTHLLRPMLVETAKRSAEGKVRVCWAGSIGIEWAAPPGSVLFETKGGEERVKEGLDKIPTYGMSKCANVMLGVEGARRDGADGIIHTSFNPGNLYSELTRHAGWIQRMALKPVLYPTKFGAYTELFSGWSPEVTKEKNGCYVLPWGRIGTYNVAIEKAIEKNENGGEGKAEKLYEVCWDITKAYM
ncbi:short-chain alcohol dehydrogenase [Didymosphaeria variabile]|uniref:Short-chain alcohol dehydrogenase n=1 Tax=Didymosphaeria variabile TaxID=1932322 RepID=A0A9W9C5U6_9PLEO|nr:short-chain alcohol dehydrogenase [Didymosphaeria variabile]KAJ4345842.1 short-chain alcohol dehydrogenase [Didymosphaeria variabile]